MVLHFIRATFLLVIAAVSSSIASAAQFLQTEYIHVHPPFLTHSTGLHYLCGI